MNKFSPMACTHTSAGESDGCPLCDRRGSSGEGAGPWGDGGSEVDDQTMELIRLLARLFRHVKAEGRTPEVLRALLHGTDLGPRHVHTMFALAMTGPIGVGTLAGNMGLSPATVSQLVNEMDRAGLVERRQDEKDRRRTIVTLAEPHRSKIVRCARERLAPLRVTLETLAPDERECFMKGVRTMIEIHDRMRGAAPEVSPGA